MIKLNAVKNGVFQPEQHKALGTVEPKEDFEIRQGDLLVTRANTPQLVGDACHVGDCPPRLMLSDLHYRLTLDKRKADGRFVAYGLISSWGRAQATASARGSSQSMVKLNQEHIRSWVLPVPPLPTQRAIADFLDHKTAAIDALIEKKERLLELLAEKRAALIHRAVTKGLDGAGGGPDVPMKDSGVPWIGEIPTHWEVKRLKFLLMGIEQGWSPECEQRLADEGRWGVLKVGCVNHGVWNPNEHKALPDTLEPRTRFEVESGDVLMSRANTSELVGSVARVSSTGGVRLLLCDKLYRLAVNADVDADFLVLLLNSWVARKQHEVASSGASASMQNISQDRAGNLVLAVPPPEEQRSLAAGLDAILGAVATTRKALNYQLERLREYRQALITAAVTGQLDIPGAP